MDNAQKALQMAFAVFLFIIAATTAIFLYSVLMENSQEILRYSDNMDMTAETVLYGEEKTAVRTLDKASQQEVVMAVLDIDNNKSYIDSIVVSNDPGVEKTYTTSLNLNLKNIATKPTDMINRYYKVEYVYNKDKIKTLKYTYVGD